MGMVIVKPADFPLGSYRSRAAARAMLAEKQSAYARREVILCRNANEGAKPRATEWQINTKERSAGRVVSVPEGMTLAEGLRALGGYSDRELAQAAELFPKPLNFATMLTLRRYPKNSAFSNSAI